MNTGVSYLEIGCAREAFGNFFAANDVASAAPSNRVSTYVCSWKSGSIQARLVSVGLRELYAHQASATRVSPDGVLHSDVVRDHHRISIIPYGVHCQYLSSRGERRCRPAIGIGTGVHTDGGLRAQRRRHGGATHLG